MLLFIACLIGQFEPATHQMTVDEYLKICEEQKQANAADMIPRLQSTLPPRGYKFTSKADRERTLARIKEIADMKAAVADPTQLPPADMMVTALAIGKAGVLCEPGNNNPHLEVLQIVGKDLLLCTHGDRLFAVRTSTEKYADGQVFQLDGIWSVSGKYTYTNAVNARKTVFVIERWKLEGEYHKTVEKLKADAAKAAAEKKAAKKKPAVKK